MRILIIEDNAADAELAEREITREFDGDVETSRVETRDGFLAALDEFKPDLIISDYMMPTFDGMSALKIALRRAPEIPFILFTGSMNEDTAVACMKAGAWDYIIKEHRKRLGPAVRAAMAEKEVRREREKARLEAEAAYRVKRDFLANISHELRTPLNGILGMCQILDNLEFGPNERFWLSMATQSAEKLNRMIVDLLDFIDLESKTILVESNPFPVKKLVDSVIEGFRKETEEKEIRLTHENECVHDAFVGDKGRIAQILWHLLSNAVKFTEKGFIRISTKEHGDTLCIVVEDSGIGIEESRLDDIFLPLQQLENPYTKAHGGVGLGLSLARNLVALLKGEVRVVSTPGTGSRFEVTVPGTFADIGSQRKEDYLKKSDRSSERAPAESGERRKTILVVEDEAINRLYVCTVLKKRGFTVLEAGNGRDAVATAASSHPDLILMDIGLPVMDGLTASKEIRSTPETEAIPILALTAHAHPEDITRFLDGGMAEVLTKPMHERELMEMVDRYVGS